VGVISAASNAFSTEIPVGTNPVALAETHDGKKLYSVNQGDGTVSVIDTANAVVLGTIPLGVGSSPVWALLSSDGLSLYVLDRGLSNLAVIDTLTDTALGSVPVGDSPNHMFLDPRLNRLYVTNQGDNTVSVLDASLPPPGIPKLLTFVPVPPTPTAVAALPNGTRAYVSSLGVNVAAATGTVSVTVIDTASNKVLQTVRFDTSSAVCDASVRFRSFVAASVDSAKFYVSSCDAGTTHILSSATNTEIASIASPVSAFAPAKAGAQPPPQRPVFILSGQ
jgi:YVTN family beta-propeller protein